MSKSRLDKLIDEGRTDKRATLESRVSSAIAAKIKDDIRKIAKADIRPSILRVVRYLKEEYGVNVSESTVRRWVNEQSR